MLRNDRLHFFLEGGGGDSAQRFAMSKQKRKALFSILHLNLGNKAFLQNRHSVLTSPNNYNVPESLTTYRLLLTQLKTTVLFLYANTLRSICFSTACESTIFSKSRPLRTNSSTVSLCEICVTSCSIMGPASKSLVT